MKMFILFLITLQTSTLFAQLTDEEFESLLKSEDIVILNENMKVSYVGQKAFFINVVVEKEIEYQILTKEGNAYLDPFILPQPFDEIYKPHAPAVRNELRLFDEVTISEIEAQLIHPDGKTEDVEIKKKIQKHQMVTELDRFGEIYSHCYSFGDVGPGEVLKIKFQYSFLFKNNWERLLSSRFFLVTKIPRKKFDLTLSHNYYLEVDTNYFNGATPKMDTLDETVYYSWHFENQPGCLDEEGSRPHTNLPWFTFTPKPYEFLYEHYNSFKEEFIPFWYYLSFYREAKLRSAVVDFKIGAKDKDNLMFDKIARKFSNMAPDDSIGITRLRYLQRYIVDSTQYNDDYKLFNNEENYKRDHPGRELSGRIIKESNKECIYASMIPKMGNMFFTAYPTDARSGYINQNYYAPMLDNEFMFASILNNNSLAYVMPKSDKRNLYCEELPFYYENAPVMLLYTYDFAGYKRNFADVIRNINTPGSSVMDNYRKTNGMVNINIAEDEIFFKLKISLAGQYSTLCRFIYNGGPVESTINPIYLEKAWEFGKSQNVSNVTVGNTDYFFPFKTEVNANYSVSGMNQKNEGIIEIDLSGWMKHVIYNDFNAENRYTDFYPDFTGTDSYNYMIEFDQEVSFAEPPENIDVNNDFGTYKFSVKQMGENKLLVSSYFLIKSHMVKKENIEQVALIYNAIEESDRMVLKLRLGQK